MVVFRLLFGRAVVDLILKKGEKRRRRRMWLVNRWIKQEAHRDKKQEGGGEVNANTRMHANDYIYQMSISGRGGGREGGGRDG